VNIEYDPAELEEIVTQLSPIQTSGLSFSGKLKANTAVIKINLGFGNEITSSKTFSITKTADSEYDQVKRIWAYMKIARLDLQFEKNKETITRLGKEFSIVTQNTSLIVLDRLEDYVEHEITPPAELQKEYFSLLKQKQQEKKDEKATAFNEALEAMKELKEWWHKNYVPVKKAQVDEGTVRVDSIDQEAVYNYSPSQVQLEAFVSDSITYGVSGLIASDMPAGNSNYFMFEKEAQEPNSNDWYNGKAEEYD
jgi:hypothetical protein